MNRKQFLKTLAITAAAPSLVRAAAQSPAPAAYTPPKPVAQLPSTVFPPAFDDAGGWTLALLPDTQKYTNEHRFPDVYLRQARWLAENKERLNLRFVAHEGDIVDTNVHSEWLVAKEAHDILFNHGVPFSLTTGNHDLGPWGGTTSRATFLNDHFNGRHYRHSAKSGLFEPHHLENSWHRFATPHGDKLLLSLEFGPRDSVLEWADKIAGDNAELDTIVVTHAYLFSDSTRYDWAAKGKKQRWNPHSYKLRRDVNDAQEMWDKLISRHANIRFVCCGHVLHAGTGYLASAGAGGRVVHQILANYQGGVKPDRGHGGGGFMRLMRFNDDRKTVAVKTYSPWYDQWLDDEANDFSLTL
ncbi:MAG: hypothetical protein LBI02_03870 [Opitutaceae bacterium]|jgi:hypothetical protein|nr:hypothetical protein [Opitutaceae bacterium]